MGARTAAVRAGTAAARCVFKCMSSLAADLDCSEQACEHLPLLQVGDWGYTNGYGYIAFIYNVCYSVALFWMLLFYVGTEELLHVREGFRV